MIVLDGATSVRSDVPPAGGYVDTLAGVLAETVDGPADPTTLVSDAILTTAHTLALHPGIAPSSTVALLRDRGDMIEVVALGDSTIVIGLADGSQERVVDDRLARLAPGLRAELRDRLREGAGYDEHHRELLRALQAAECSARNTEDGYWIAEAAPEAGRHTVIRRYPRSAVRWAVLATDGAQRGLDHHGVRWAGLPGETTAQLRAKLGELHRWESEDDPNGRALPRSKRHDDKTLVTWTPAPTCAYAPTQTHHCC